MKRFIIILSIILGSISLGWMLSESTHKPVIEPYPIRVFVPLPAPKLDTKLQEFQTEIIQRQQAQIGKLEAKNFWLAQKQELKFFQSMDEFRNWKSQYDYIDMEQRLLQSNQQFFDETIPPSVRCVPHAYGLMLLAADDGYILSVGQANNYTHWVNELVLGRLLYGIDPVTGYTYYMTYAADSIIWY